MPPERHLQVQPTTPGARAPSGPLRVRQRIQKACAPCRRRKIKCDGNQPCAACAGYGYSCVFEATAPRIRPSSSRPSSPVPAQPGTFEPYTGPVLALEPVQPADVLFMSLEQRVEVPIGNTCLQQSLKTRFTSAHSAIAWPKAIGISLGLPVPPRLQSFAWNPSNRPEPHVLPQSSIRDIISLDEMKVLSEVYFRAVHPIFGILDQNTFEKRSIDFWFSQQQGTDLECCICQVVALGSYFSKKGPSPHEAQVVDLGRLLLDLSISHAPVLLSVKHVVAWVLRAIYLRCTTRPHLSWMASNNALHIAEAIGLHREFSEIHKNHEMFHNITSEEMDLRRRTFWVAMSLNQFFSSEYGRSRVRIDFVGMKPLAPQDGDDFTADTITILQAVPQSQHPPENDSSGLIDLLKRVVTLPVKAPFLALLRADASFCILRMLSSAKIHVPSTEVTSLLDVIRVALDAVKFLRTMQKPWWNLVYTPFHSVCVLLTLGTSESLAMIPHVMDILKKTTEVYNSHLSAEALRTAYLLVQGTRDKAVRDLEGLNAGLYIVGDMPSSESAVSGNNDFEWSFNNELGTSEF